MSKSEELSIDEHTIRKIVHKYLEKEKSNSHSKINSSFDSTLTKKIIPFSITRIKVKSVESIKDKGVDWFTGIKDYNNRSYKSGDMISVSFIMKVKTGYDTTREVGDNIIIFQDEYITESRNEKIKSLGVTLGDKVRIKIDEYLGFNSDELFPINSMVRVFGGCIRDIISNREINDIDILVGAGSLGYVENILSDNGYKYMESLTPKDLSSIYSDIKIINEPHSWVKEDKIVQIIRPAVGQMDSNEVTYKKSFIDLIQNVDISCCGVSYDGEKVYENYESAVSHCKNGIFIVNRRAKMYSERRITHRKVKLTSRGWIEVKPDAATYRDLKIDKILSEEILDYVPEYKDNLYYSNQYSDDDLYK